MFTPPLCTAMCIVVIQAWPRATAMAQAINAPPFRQLQVGGLYRICGPPAQIAESTHPWWGPRGSLGGQDLARAQLAEDQHPTTPLAVGPRPAARGEKPSILLSGGVQASLLSADAAPFEPLDADADGVAGEDFSAGAADAADGAVVAGAVRRGVFAEWWRNRFVKSVGGGSSSEDQPVSMCFPPFELCGQNGPCLELPTSSLNDAPPARRVVILYRVILCVISFPVRVWPL